MQTEKGHDKVAVVKQIANAPRSYIVSSEGKAYRRNKSHFFPVAEPKPDSTVTLDQSNDITHESQITLPTTVKSPNEPARSLQV